MAQRGIRGLVAILIFASLSLLGVAGPGATSIITPVEGSLDASLVVRVSTVTPLLLNDDPRVLKARQQLASALF